MSKIQRIQKAEIEAFLADGSEMNECFGETANIYLYQDGDARYAYKEYNDEFRKDCGKMPQYLEHLFGEIPDDKYFMLRNWGAFPLYYIYDKDTFRGFIMDRLPDSCYEDFESNCHEGKAERNISTLLGYVERINEKDLAGFVNTLEKIILFFHRRHVMLNDVLSSKNVCIRKDASGLNPYLIDTDSMMYGHMHPLGTYDSACYEPPQQDMDARSEKTDIYKFSCIVLRLFATQIPSSKRAELTRDIRRGYPDDNAIRSLDHIEQVFGSAYRKLVFNGLSENPKDRPTIEEFIAAHEAKRIPAITPEASGNRKPGLNDPCPCGSGLKYKNCHGKTVADVSKTITNTDLSEKQNANKPRRQTITYVHKADNKRKARTKKTVSRIAFAFAALAICLGVVVLCKKVFFSNKAKPLSAVFFDSAKQGDTFILGKYEQDNQLENGPEDIEWVVVNTENGLVLAMSKYCLESMPYAEGEHIETDWEHCSLRQWLNDDFYNACFSDTEKRWICSTCLQNPDAFAFQTPGGYNTVDHVFLLSGPDLVNCYDGYDFKLLQYSWNKSVTDQKMTKIISASSNFPELKTTYTPYAKEMYFKQQRIAWGSLKTEEGIREDYADIENEYGNSAADWWLRSPGEWLDDTMLVSWSGTAYSNPSRSSSIGVRPAILLSATAMDSDPSGSGSVSKRPDVLTSETDPFSPKQWVADEQKVLVTLDDGSVIYIGYHMNDYDSVSSWKNIKKVAVGEGIVVGLTNDGSIVYSALDETAYDFASLTKLKDICDVCICNNAENPTNDKYHGLILCLSTDGTVYGTFAGGCNTYQDNCKGISASEDEFIILNTDGTISGNTYNHGSYPLVNVWTDIIQVACGNNFIAGLKSDGTVVVDGNCVTPTLSGERVLKQDETYGAIDESFNVSDWKEIVAIAAGTHHLAGLKRDGTVVAIGLNYYGQCDTDDWSTIVSVEASHNLTIGHMADGSIVLAGKNIVDNVIDLQGKADANIYYSR